VTATGAAAIVGWGVAMACVVGAVMVRVVAPAPFLPVTFGFGPLAMGAFLLMATSWATIGAFLAIRRPGNAIGAVMVVSGAGYALSMLALALTFAVAADGTARGLELAGIAGWVTVLGTQIGAFAFLIGFIFPTGRGQSGAWHWAVRLGLPGMLLFGAVILLQPGSLHLFPTLANPFGVGPDLRFGQPVSPIVGLFGVTLSPLVAVSMATRYRAAGRVERLQLKWFSLAVIAAFLGVGASASAVVYVQGSPSETGLIVYGLALACVPVAIAIAILRHHLYDIDRLISRSLGYGVVSAILGAVFVGIVLAMQALLAPFTKEQTIAVAVSTLVVFALFQPVRRWVQSIVDRRFDRSRYDAERTAAAFAVRLRNETDMATVTTDLAATTTSTVAPSSLSIWLRTRGVHR
jgi:MFS family permease